MSKPICPKCDKPFFSKQTLNRHLASKKDCSQKNYVNICGQCGKSFSSKTSIYYHKKICNQKLLSKKQDEILNQNAELKNILLNLSKSQQPTVINIQNNYNTYNKCNFIENTYPNAPNFSLEDFLSEIEDEEYEKYEKYIEIKDNADPAVVIKNGVSNIFRDKMIKDIPNEERALWCINSKDKIFLVKDNDQWKRDKQGATYVTPKLDDCKIPLINLLVNQIYEINQEIIKIGESENDESSNENENLEILKKEKEKELFRKNKTLKKYIDIIKRENFSKRVLYKLSDDLVFNQENFNKFQATIENTIENMIENC